LPFSLLAALGGLLHGQVLLVLESHQLLLRLHLSVGVRTLVVAALLVVVATELGTAVVPAVVAATAVAASLLETGDGERDLQALVHNRVAVELLDGVAGAGGGDELHEAVAAALASLTIADNLDALDRAVLLKELTELELVDRRGDVVHHQVAVSFRLGVLLLGCLGHFLC